MIVPEAPFFYLESTLRPRQGLASAGRTRCNCCSHQAAERRPLRTWVSLRAKRGKHKKRAGGRGTSRQAADMVQHRAGQTYLNRSAGTFASVGSFTRRGRCCAGGEQSSRPVRQGSKRDPSKRVQKGKAFHFSVPAPTYSLHTLHARTASGPSSGTIIKCGEQALQQSLPQMRQWWRRLYRDMDERTKEAAQHLVNTHTPIPRKRLRAEIARGARVVRFPGPQERHRSARLRLRARQSLGAAGRRRGRRWPHLHRVLE